MKQLGLNPNEHLRNPDGISVGSVGRAVRARRRIASILNDTIIDDDSYWPSGTAESYLYLQNRAQYQHNMRLSEVRGILQELLDRGDIGIEDGGIKSEESLRRKVADQSTRTYNIARASDLSRLRIVAKDLSTMFKVITLLQSDIGRDGYDTFIRKARHTYGRVSSRKSLFSGFFFNILSKSVKSTVESGSEDAVDISTELQVVTKRVHSISENNRDAYVDLTTRRSTGFVEYNKLMLRAILLDWKEYFKGKQ